MEGGSEREAEPRGLGLTHVCLIRFLSQACLPIIYAQEWSNVSERVLKQFGITRLRPEVLVQT